MGKEIRIQASELERFVKEVLRKASVREDVAAYVAEGLAQTSLRGVDSHGIRLLAHYLNGVKGGRINPSPNYKFKKTSQSTGLLDADHTFGHAAGMEAVKRAVELARKAGSGHVAVYNSTHFGAAAYYSLEIAKHDMIGMSFTHADALMRSHGGKKPFLGTNPISFAAPCEGEEPFCLDMATSMITFNKVKQLRQAKTLAPAGAGADASGVETTDPNQITMLLPSGGYKGFGLSMMVEILCSMLTGMPYGPYLSKMFAAPINEKRFLAHFITAIRIDCFQDKKVFKNRLSMMMNEIRKGSALDVNTPVQVAGDPEKKTALHRTRHGITLDDAEYASLKAAGKEYGIELERQNV